MIDFLAALNPSQREAATLPAEHALILAGAGSGKTRVLISRIAWLLRSGRAKPHEILAVTFTNKAARQMQDRLQELLGEQPRSMWVGTFHGLCNRLLRLHNMEAALPPAFQIMDSADQQAMIKRIMKNLGYDEERDTPRSLARFVNVHKEQGLRAAYAQNLESNPTIARCIALYNEYETQCQREGVVDFAELILRAYELLSHHQPLRDHYRSRFRYLLIDEFQDTNRLQYAWLQRLAQAPTGQEAAKRSDGAVIFAVGDDDQSIYRFRGAEIGNMTDFERKYADGRVIRLEQNYRSDGNILAAANAVISHNCDRFGKNLWTERTAGAPIRFCCARSDFDEAQWIAETIQAHVRAGMPYRENAVLYRSNAQSRVLEHQLLAHRIPYRVYGGLRFFERQEVKHALAYLRLIVNSGDDSAFLRIVNFPTRGIGAKTLEILQQQGHQHRCSLYDIAAAGSSLSGRAKTAVASFIALIEQLRHDSGKMTALSLPECVSLVLEDSGLLNHYRQERHEGDREERLANLDELINAASSFAADNQTALEGGLLSEFLAFAALESGEQGGESDDAVQLMTVHSAKGLEFEAVYVSGLEQDLFPHGNALREHAGLEEERRLFYVAMTRARRWLYLSHAQTRLLHGEPRFCRPSRFLDDIPSHLLQYEHGSGAIFTDYDETARSAGSSITSFSRRTADDSRYEDGHQPYGGLRIGQSVRHARFGEGVILAIEGQDSDARAQISFAESGTKWLILSLANLQEL